MTLDIQKLAAAAVASVEDDTVVKQAAVDAPPALMTSVGQQLKLAAEMVRDLDLSTVTDADLGDLLKLATVGGTLGGVTGSGNSPAGADLSGNATSTTMTPGAMQATMQPPPTNLMATPKLASELGNELRTLATTVRTAGQHAEEQRLIKAAHMYNAGIALTHLIGEAQ